MRRNVKKEKQTDKGDASAEPVRTKVAGVARDESADVESNQPNREEDAADRRVLRSKYLALMTKISGAREEISNVDSNKFNIIINEVDNLHQQVSKPREQVADAEALLGLANTLATSVKSISCEGISLADLFTVDETGAEEKTDTDRNMAVMFEILRRKRQVKLESFILNRSSFAQTVENLFSLSFLVKDGRVEIVVHGSGSHIVSPKNAPAASSIASGEAAYSHFVFRFDFKDWKVMMNAVPVGDELMPHREDSHPTLSQAEPAANSSGASTTTPIRKLSRNRGLILQESIVDDSPEPDDANKGPGIRRCRRKVN